MRDQASQNNEINYHLDGTTDYNDNQTNETVRGTHEFDFSTIYFTFKDTANAGTEEQTDFTPPELVSFDISDRNFTGQPDEESPDLVDEVEENNEEDIIVKNSELAAWAGDTIFLKYDAIDAEHDINSINVYFRHSISGQSISGHDSDGDGFIRFSLSSDLENGEYEFDYIRLQDNANQNNQIKYEDNGTTETYDPSISQTVYGMHNLNLDNLK